MKQFSILIIGGGSIGTRHLKNLIALGQKNIAVVETNADRAAALHREHGVETAASLAAALKLKKFDAVFVCSPSTYHLEQTAQALRQGSHVFVEKPLATQAAGLKEVVALAAKKKSITMVGCNWKFYPLFQTMKELLEAGAIGRVLSARCQFGQYLPDWHPWEDYRKGYSANKKLGGGILLDSHEFDYLTWFMDEPVVKVACLAGKVSDLDIDVEDTAEVLLQFGSGAIGEIHLDYTQRFYQRNFEFFGEWGTIFWDTNAKKVVLKKIKQPDQEFLLPKKYDTNDMYVEEVKHFLQCVEKNKQTIMPLSAGAWVIELIVAAKTAAQKNKVITF